MMDSIDSDGELTKTKAPASWYLTNFRTLDCWTIGLPKSDKYLKYEQLKRTTNRISNCRKIMAYTAPIMIVCGFFIDDGRMKKNKTLSTTMAIKHRPNQPNRSYAS